MTMIEFITHPVTVAVTFIAVFVALLGFVVYRQEHHRNKH